METIFTKIISGDIPSYKIHETEKFFTFLDINPNAKGHTLVIPKKHVDKLFDLDTDTYTEILVYAKKIATALEKTVACKRIGMTAIGLEVPHAHIHLIPLNQMSDATFTKKVSMTDEEFHALAAAISNNIEL